MTEEPSIEEISPEFICRVCHGEGTETSPLQYPCQCSGSIRYIHKDCLTKWLNVSGREICEVCGHKFVYKNLYKEDMPSTLPLSIMLSGIRDLGCYILSAIMWIFVVPCTMGRIAQNMLFLSPIEGVGQLITKGLTANGLGGTFLLGMLVMVSFAAIIWGLCQLYPAIIRHKCHELYVTMDNGNAPELQQDNHEDGEEEEEEEDDDDNLDSDSDDNNEFEVEDPQPHVQQPHLVPNNRFGIPRVIIDPQQAENIPANHLIGPLDWSQVLGLDCKFTYLMYILKFLAAFVTCVFFVNTFFFIGSGFLEALHLMEYIMKLFRGLLSVVVGHVIVAVIVFQINRYSRYRRHSKYCYISGMFYVILKFTIYIINKLFIFPIFCGLAMSLALSELLGTSLSSLVEEFSANPFTTLITHWIQGHIFNMCICQFIIETRRSLRSGIIWFFIDFDDPELNPIKNIIIGSVRGHISGFIYSSLYFGFTIVLVIWLPLYELKYIYKELPFESDESTWRVLVERLALPFFLMCWLYPGFVFKLWCQFCADTMDLKSYLFGNVTTNSGDQIVHSDGSVTIAERDNVPLSTRRTRNNNSNRNYLFTEYIQPKTWFRSRVAVFVVLTSCLISFICFLNYWASLLLADFLEKLTPNWNISRVLYFVMALCILEILIKLGLKYCVSGDPNQRQEVVGQFRDYIFYIVIILAALTIVFFIPYLVGHLLDITIFKPWEFVDTSADRFLIKWLIGLEAALTLLPMVVIFCYLDLLYSGRNPRDIDIKQFIEKTMKSLCRSILILAVSLLISYLLNQGVFLMLPSDYKSYSENFQPYITIIIYAAAILSDCSSIWKKFCVKIRDDRYLLGRELLNYSATDFQN